jgi:hypothetical protein
MNSAEDESGLEMAADFESDFRILQQSTIKLRSVDAYDGYVYAPNIQAQEHAVSEGQTFFVGTWSRGFLTFDLSEMPQNAIDIEEAELRIKQKDHQDGAYETPGTGGLSVWTVHYGTLTNDDFNKAPNENLRLRVRSHRMGRDGRLEISGRHDPGPGRLGACRRA